MNEAAAKILIVDDELDILEFLSYNLEKEGYTVFTAHNGKQGFEAVRNIKPDLVILDVMMPEMDGIETCKEIRALPGNENIRIAFLTARGEDYSQIAGFEAGADDYISKPIKPRVFVSRIKALLRRSPEQVQVNANVLDFENLRIDKSSYLVKFKDNEMQMPKKEFELLYLLASKPGKVFNRDEILRIVWGQEVVVGDRTIDVHIRKLREKLDDNFIKTIKGVGYKFEI